MQENDADKNIRKNNSILIAGGSGLVGKYLTSLLLSEGYKVSHLSRKSYQFGKVRVFRWNYEKGIIDPVIFDGIDFIINLAGANIGEMRWTKKRKDEIIKSRVESTRFLYKVISDNGIQIKAFISASASGYYGSATSDKIYIESDPPATDFTGTVCRLWEEAADLFGNAGIRTVKIRTAVVLEKNDSALAKLMKPAEYGFLVQAGNGRQYMPWIHILDLCNIYLKAIEDSNLQGAYNAVSPDHVTHRDFMKTLAQIMKKPIFFTGIPSFVLRAALGEMSEIILKGSRVSSEKIMNSGYTFHFNNLKVALEDILCS